MVKLDDWWYGRTWISDNINRNRSIIMEWLVAKLGASAAQYAAGGAAAVGVAWALKKIPNATIKAKFGMLMYGAGVACTLGLAKFKWTKKVYIKTIEPYIVHAIDNIVAHGIQEFVRGLRSDN